MKAAHGWQEANDHGVNVAIGCHKCRRNKRGLEDDERCTEDNESHIIIGGKSSCRRNFALDVSLDPVVAEESGERTFEALKPVARVELVADDTSSLPPPDEKDAASDEEASLYVVNRGQKVAASNAKLPLPRGHLRSKLVTTRLSSSSCALFRIKVEVALAGRPTLLRGYSRPFRCVSKILRSHFEPGSPKLPFQQRPQPAGSEQQPKQSLSGSKRPEPEAPESETQKSVPMQPWMCNPLVLQNLLMDPKFQLQMMPQMAAVLATQQVNCLKSQCCQENACVEQAYFCLGSGQCKGNASKRAP